jgi:putative addiction module component (TIGR02574 family)
MARHTENLYRKALELPAIERAGLVDRLLSSLDSPDKKIDGIWRKEINDRLQAYKAGKMETVSVKEVLAKYKSK